MTLLLFNDAFPKAHMYSLSKKALFLTTRLTGCSWINFIHETSPLWLCIIFPVSYIFFFLLVHAPFYPLSWLSTYALLLSCGTYRPPVLLVSPMALVTTNRIWPPPLGQSIHQHTPYFGKLEHALVPPQTINPSKPQLQDYWQTSFKWAFTTYRFT